MKRSSTLNAADWLDLRRQDGVSTAHLRGSWRLANLRDIGAALQGLQLASDERLVLDGSRLEQLDTAAGFELLRALQRQHVEPSTLDFSAMADKDKRLLELIRAHLPEPGTGTAGPRRSFLARIGAWACGLGSLLRAHLGFLGETVLAAQSLLARPRRFRIRETAVQLEQVMLDAIPIVALVTFLIGIVFAYLLGVQAQRFGATIFIVDGVGLAVCRELSPILVAVIVAGRSGAAFTAQLGAMKVQEETEAIRVLGLSPMQLLVLPRLIALACGLPILVFVGDLAGVAGGALVSSWLFDISLTSFFARLHAVLPISAVVVGLAKAPVFAAFIALIGCRMGLSVTRDARSVGVHTTSTVVQSIVWVIVLDAAFAVVLQQLGI